MTLRNRMGFLATSLMFPAVISVVILMPTTATAVPRQGKFVSVRFVGNRTVPSISYNGTIARVHPGIRKMRCGSLCLAVSTCHSFNFAKKNPADATGRCEVLMDENTTWIPEKFVVPAGGIIPWNTDCLNHGGTAGFVVAMRNNRSDVSIEVTDFKCRIFRHGFTMTAETPTLRQWNDFPNKDMRCPNGSVITAVFDRETKFEDAETIRCQRPAFPWAVDVARCRLIDVLKLPGNLSSSALYDPGLTGTADSIWGAQCGSQTKIEAMVAINSLLSTSNVPFYEAVECCQLRIATG